MSAPLEFPDGNHLLAAQGWLELGMPSEAHQELDRIRARLRDHPEVLSARWHACAALHQWEPALAAATLAVANHPDDPEGWIHRSFVLHELKRTQEARDHLVAVVEAFPDNPIIRYNLACYDCQLGQLAQARVWFQKALAVGKRDVLLRMALEDHDLAPLHAEFQELQRALRKEAAAD